MGKPMGHGSRAFVQNANPIWTKEWTICIFFYFSKILKDFFFSLIMFKP
jgi:hypothetical protein